MNNHPSFAAHSRIKELCSPLNQLGISYFSYVQVTSNKFFGLNTSPEMSADYIKTKAYNVDLHVEGNMYLNENDKLYTLWDALENKEKIDTRSNIQLAQKFDIAHLFTITEKTKQHTECYHFASTVENHAINQFYYNNLDLLNKFILYFKERLKIEKQLNKIFDLGFSLTPLKSRPLFDIPKKLALPVDKQTSFSNDENLFSQQDMLNLFDGQQVKEFRQPILSPREASCLLWTAKGKTAWEISIILNLSLHTVREYIKLAIKKLKASNKTEAVVRAMLSNEIDCDEIYNWNNK